MPPEDETHLSDDMCHEELRFVTLRHRLGLHHLRVRFDVAAWRIARQVQNVVHMARPHAVLDVLGARVGDHVALGDVFRCNLALLHCLGDHFDATAKPHRLLRRGIRSSTEDRGLGST